MATDGDAVSALDAAVAPADKHAARRRQLAAHTEDLRRALGGGGVAYLRAVEAWRKKLLYDTSKLAPLSMAIKKAAKRTNDFIAGGVTQVHEIMFNVMS